LKVRELGDDVRSLPGGPKADRLPVRRHVAWRIGTRDATPTRVPHETDKPLGDAPRSESSSLAEERPSATPPLFAIAGAGTGRPPEPVRSTSETRVKAVSPQRRLLVVEDQNMLGRLFRDLAAEFCEAWLATSAHQALAMLEALPFDVVLADANLGSPRSGIWLHREVALRWPRIRRCLMSGADHQPVGDEYVFFFKPLSMEDLRSAVFGDADPTLQRPWLKAL
jgi:hypothetical protein